MLSWGHDLQLSCLLNFAAAPAGMSNIAACKANSERQSDDFQQQHLHQWQQDVFWVLVQLPKEAQLESPYAPCVVLPAG